MTLNLIIIIVLLLLGIILILVETFLLPGITIAGIAGGIVLASSVAYAFMYVGKGAGYITIVVAAIIGIGGFIYIVKSKAMDRIALKTDIDSTVEIDYKGKIEVGSVGFALSRLNPIGNVDFGNDIIAESKSYTGEFIDTETKVKVVKMDGSSIFVEQY